MYCPVGHKEQNGRKKHSGSSLGGFFDPIHGSYPYRYDGKKNYRGGPKGICEEGLFPDTQVAGFIQRIVIQLLYYG